MKKTVSDSESKTERDVQCAAAAALYAKTNALQKMSFLTRQCV